MKLSKNTILITGGASGIGLALAKRFVTAGSEVIVCGRRKEKLEEAKRLIKGLHILKCDVASEEERKSLAEQVIRDFPTLNVLINNAGIQNLPPLLKEPQSWENHRQEIATNLEAPIHLSMLFIPQLLKQNTSTIINVSSGLAFLPLASMPTYCATKAAIHSFTLCLRHQLKSSPIQVIELIPPAVNTDLGGKGLHTYGVPLDEFADHAMKCIEQGELEFGYGSSEKGRLASREQANELFASMNP
ncbi:MAG: SDR family NAD(P)-dependent oxidoreductase [Chlamydiae bacterium]|nr:SDR family NAD(P)-dependent oxidoreductase [Chlamydiota bacterium]